MNDKLIRTAAEKIVIELLEYDNMDFNAEEQSYHDRRVTFVTDVITALRAAPSTPPAPADYSHMPPMQSPLYELWKLLHDEHGILALESELQDILKKARACTPPAPASLAREKAVKKCHHCDGLGYYAADDGTGHLEQFQCEDCYGTGEIPSSAALTPGDAGGEGQAQGGTTLGILQAVTKERDELEAEVARLSGAAEVGATAALRFAKQEAEIERLKDTAKFAGDECLRFAKESDDLRAQLATATANLGHADEKIHELQKYIRSGLTATPPAAPSNKD